jgi:5-formyltetrahydrofolate cyclo-ligase
LKWLKQQLRERIIEKRRHLDAAAQAHWGQQIATRLFQSRSYQQARHIAFYYSVGGEVPTALILAHALAQHKCCYLPVLKDKRYLQFVRIDDKTRLTPNRFGILEPPIHANTLLSPQYLDLVLVPLVAFDKAGYRLGMGGGYYDATFAFSRHSAQPLLIGLAYEFQRVDDIPRTDSDILVDEVITEKKNYARTSLLSPK